MQTKKTSHGDTIIQIALSLCCAYLSFFIGEGLFHVSGVLATVVAAVLVGSYGWPYFTSRGFMLEFWHCMEWLFNTILFFLSGAIMGDMFQYSTELFTENVGKIILLFIGMTVIRALLVGLFYYPLSCMGYGFSKQDALVLIWGGLRGAVGLALAIDILHKFYVGPCCPTGSFDSHCIGFGPQNSTNGTKPHVLSGGGGGFDAEMASTHCETLGKFSSEAFLFIAVYALLTLVINGTTTGFLLNYLGMMTTTETEAILVHFTENAVRKSCTDAFEKQSASLYPEAFSEGLKSRIRDNVTQLDSKKNGTELPPLEDSGEVIKHVALLFFRILRNEYVVQADEGLIRDDVSAPLLESADQTIEALKSNADDEEVYDDFVFIDRFLGVDSQSSCLTCLMNYTCGLCKGAIFVATSDGESYTVPEFERRYDQGMLSYIVAHRRAEQKLTELLGFADTGGSANELLMQQANKIVSFSQQSSQKAREVIVARKGALDDKKAEQVSRMLFEQNRLVIARFQDVGVLDATQAHKLIHDLEHDMEELEKKLADDAEKADEIAAGQEEGTEMAATAEKADNA